MDEEAITRFITATFADVRTETSEGSFFYFFGEERNFPFATLVTTDRYDQASDLDRPGVFRLNVGLNRATFRTLFPEDRSGVEDFAALDRIMPHPVYGSMFWVCVLNPSEATFEAVRPLLAEAHEKAAKRGGATEGGE